MTEPLSPNTQAILLLTAPLIVGRASEERSLTPAQYGRLAQHLREIGRQPADLLNDGADGLLQDCASRMSLR